jgi:hypothetical protein
MRLFCDQCGGEFGGLALREDSKFCPLCGKGLSEFIKEQLATGVKSPAKDDATIDSTTLGEKRKSVEADQDAEEHRDKQARNGEPVEPHTTPTKRGRGRPRSKTLEIAKNGSGESIAEECSFTEESGESEENVHSFICD